MKLASILHTAVSIGALLPLSLRAQTHNVAPPAAVTRAVAVYEWTGEFAHPISARLVPVSLFAANPIGDQPGGHLEDAGVYLAQPVPFALQTGDVYSVERSGEILGLLELTSAQDIHTRADAAGDNPLGTWYGYGRLLTTAENAEANTQRAAPPAPRAVDAARGPDAPPILRHRNPSGEAKLLAHPAAAGYVTPPSTPLNDDPGRPILHRGIPAEAASTPPLTALPPNLHQAIAISDAVNRRSEIFTYMWPNARDRAQTLSSLEALADPILERYIAFNKLTPASAAIAPPARTGPSFANGLPSKDALFNHQQLLAYDLRADDLPTVVYTAEAPVTNGGPVYLTLVAQRLPSGELHLALSSITDAAHLDRTPRLLLIDAVDADASHRASLLFELRAQSSRQFSLYSLATGDAEQTFITDPIE